MEIEAKVNEALPARCTLGEGALWDAARKVVWFVDIKRHHLWHYDPASGSNARAEAPGQIGWALPAKDGRLLCGLKDGLYLFSPETQTFAKLSDIPGEPAGNRLNDACTDPSGRVWFGSMDDAEEAASGRFYLFDRGHIAPAGPDGIAITNGPAVNAEGTKIYFTDTVGQTILVADLTPDGGVGEARVFADTKAHFPDAYPDGPVVDAEGHVWTGLYAGWHVARFSPDGKLVGTVKMPTANVTKMAFGGEDLRTVFVTTARKNLDEAALAAQPLAGSLLTFRAPVAGFAQARVKLA
jgi:sugar lactone lactonase YvrE